MTTFNFSVQAIKAITQSIDFLVSSAAEDEKKESEFTGKVQALASEIIKQVGKGNAVLACDEIMIIYKRQLAANGWKTSAGAGKILQNKVQNLTRIIARQATGNEAMTYNKNGFCLPKQKSAKQPTASGKDSQGTKSGDCQTSKEAMTSSDTDNFVFSEDTDKAQARAMLTSQLTDMIKIGLLDIATLQEIVSNVALAVGGGKANINNDLAKAFKAKGFKVA